MAKLNFENGFSILADVVRNNKRHVDYRHTVNLSVFYKKVITGEDVNTLLKRVWLREDEERWKLRDELTVALTPAWCNAAMSDFYFVGRLDNVKKSISYPKEDARGELRVAEVRERLDNFYGEDSAEKYLATNYVETSFIDPNTFIAVEFKKFNNLKEKASTYPVEWGSEYCIDYKYVNNILAYLIVKKDNTTVIKKDGTTAIVENYLMYLPDDIIQLTQTYDYEELLPVYLKQEKPVNNIWQADLKRTFIVTQYRPLAGEVQAFRVGYKRDLSRKGRTCVNPFHNSIPYLMKAIKAVSEFDITTTFHAFPRLIQATEPCPGDPKRFQTCKGGKTENGGTCKICKGKGSLTQTSGMDAIHVNIPEIAKMIKEGKSIPDLSNIAVYKNVDTGILEFQNDYIEQLERNFYSSMYTADIKRKLSANTATEINDQNQNRTNTLQPFAERVSYGWKFFARITSVVTDNGIPKLLHEYPSDLKLKTLDELYKDLDTVTKSGAPAHVKQAIINDINEKIFIDDAEALKRQKAKEKHVPFIGVPWDELQRFMDDGFILDEFKIRYIYSDTIFDEIQNEVAGFYDLPYEKQKPIIQAKVDYYLDLVNKQKAKNSAVTFTSLNEEQNGIKNRELEEKEAD